MTPEYKAMAIGGFAPAILFGLGAIFARMSTDQGLAAPGFLAASGIAVLIWAGALSLLPFEGRLTPAGFGWAFASGLFWAMGTGAVAYALLRHGASISRLAPLYNMNTLVAVVLGLAIFAEWRDLNAPRLILGAILIVAGGTLVARA